MEASDNIASDIGKSSWPKWLLAILVGAPVVGLSYYYWRNKSTSEVKHAKNGTSKVNKNRDVQEVERSRPQETPSQSPLERAVSLKNSGNDFFKKGKYEDAMKCYTEAINICPPDDREQIATFYQNRAAAHESMSNFEDVISDCSRAIEYNPIYSKALSRRVKAAEKLGRLRLSLEDATALCILERFENINTLNHADRLLKKLGAELAKELMQNKGPLYPSTFFVQSYLKTYANDPIMEGDVQAEDQGSLSQARKALGEGRLDDAIQGATAQVAEIHAASPADQKSEIYYISLLLRATALLLTSRIQLAMADLTTIVEDNPPYPKIVVNALVKRAALHLQFDDLDKCMEDFAKAEEVDPNNSDIYHQRAQVHLYSEKLEEALLDYDKVVQHTPDFQLGQLQRLYTRYRKAAAARDAELIASATAQLSATADRNKDIPEGYLLLGQVYADQQNFEAANEAFEKASKQNPQNANVLVHKGLLELQWHSDMDKAISYLEEAMDIDNKCEFAYETLASIEVQRGNLVRAVELFSKALEQAKCEKEMSHICALRAAAEAQQAVAKRLGLPNGEGVQY